MTLRNTQPTERSFFFFASFGAASLLALVASSLLSFLFSVFGTHLSLSASLWIFLFLFPAALAFSSSVIASKLESVEMPHLIYTIIVGYGAYSLISLFILLLGGRNEPALWTILILTLISVALFNTQTFLTRLGPSESAPNVVESPSRELGARLSTLPIKITSPSKEEEENTGLIFSIKKQEEGIVIVDTTEGDVRGGEGGEGDEVITLGPRS
ncbi:MAG: hypothetical protein WDZ74_01820 [Candidatus Paceibacterota bacterium]